MGYKQVDLIPIGSVGPTPITPIPKDMMEKIFQVVRADTTATLKAVIPADASISSILFYGSVASDAITSASLVVQVRNNTGVISTGTYDLKASGAIMGFVQMSNLPNIEQFPLLGDLQITAQVTEVGGATIGGPWKLAVRFVR